MFVATSSLSPDRLISTLNNAPLHAALANRPATPTSETALPFPFSASSGVFLESPMLISMSQTEFLLQQ